MNLTLANLNGPQSRDHWQRAYSFKELYGLNDLIPEETIKIADRLDNDNDVLF